MARKKFPRLQTFGLIFGVAESIAIVRAYTDPDSIIVPLFVYLLVHLPFMVIAFWKSPHRFKRMGAALLKQWAVFSLYFVLPNLVTFLAPAFGLSVALGVYSAALIHILFDLGQIYGTDELSFPKALKRIVVIPVKEFFGTFDPYRFYNDLVTTYQTRHNTNLSLDKRQLLLVGVDWIHLCMLFWPFLMFLLFPGLNNFVWGPGWVYAGMRAFDLHGPKEVRGPARILDEDEIKELRGLGKWIYYRELYIARFNWRLLEKLKMNSLYGGRQKKVDHFLIWLFLGPGNLMGHASYQFVSVLTRGVIPPLERAA